MGSSEKLRLLLDTSYLLPMLGVEVEGVEPVLELLASLYNSGLLEAYYSRFSILEMLGKISRLRYDPEIVERGLAYILEKLVEAEPGVEAYMMALRLRSRGFSDLIDLLLYSTAATRGLKLLTRDDALISFLERSGVSLDHVVHEDELLERYGKRVGAK